MNGYPRVYGVGKHANTERANILALICAVNRALAEAGITAETLVKGCP